MVAASDFDRGRTISVKKFFILEFAGPCWACMGSTLFGSFWSEVPDLCFLRNRFRIPADPERGRNSSCSSATFVDILASVVSESSRGIAKALKSWKGEITCLAPIMNDNIHNLWPEY